MGYSLHGPKMFCHKCKKFHDPKSKIGRKHAEEYKKLEKSRRKGADE